MNTLQRLQLYFDRKTVSVMYDLVKWRANERIEHRRSPKRSEKDLLVTKSVYLNQADAQNSRNEQRTVESIYFQATPSAPKSTLKDVEAVQFVSLSEFVIC